MKADGETNGAREREARPRVCSTRVLLLLVRAVSSFLRNTSRNPSTVDRAVRGVVTVDVRNPTFVPRKLPRLNGVLARGGEGTRDMLGRASARLRQLFPQHSAGWKYLARGRRDASFAVAGEESPEGLDAVDPILLSSYAK